MLNILIVDDEYLIREKLKKYIKESSFSVNLLVEANNGLDALDIIKKFDIHIALTDIRMPLLNGLEFIEEIKKNDYKTKVIFLTGFEKFEYAKKAIDFNAIDYLLKPIKKEVLYKSINKALNLIDKEEKNMLAINNLEENDKYSFLFNLLYDYENLNNCPLNIKNTNFIFITIDLNKSVNNNYIYKFLYNNFINNYEVISGFTKSSKILIISSIESIEQIDKLFNNLIENNILTYCFFSNIYTDLKDLKTAFLESFKAFSYRIFFKSNSLIHFNNINCNKFILPSNLRNDFIVLIKSKNLNKIKDIINNYLNLIDKSKDIMALKSFINDLFAALYYDNLEDKKESLISDIDYLTNNSLYINKNINDLTNFLIKKVELIINSNKIAPLPNSAYTIIRIKDYIDNNFSSQNITLEFLSNKFYINASHLSSIFKKITGDNLVEYTTKKRIEKAKLLLKDSNLKIGQVSEEVGYKDYYYFSKLFKKYVGIPPSKFKNINC